MASRAATVTLAGAAASIIGGLIYVWITKPKAERKATEEVQQIPVKAKKTFPEEITQVEMENEMDELAMSLSHIAKVKYYGLCDKIAADIRWDTIPWFRAQEFNYQLYNSRVEFMMTGIAFVVHTVNRMNKGEFIPDFVDCVRESRDIAIQAAAEIGKTHYALKARNIQYAVRDLLDLVIQGHFQVADREVRLLPKEIAV